MLRHINLYRINVVHIEHLHICLSVVMGDNIGTVLLPRQQVVLQAFEALLTRLEDRTVHVVVWRDLVAVVITDEAVADLAA